MSYYAIYTLDVDGIKNESQLEQLTSRMNSLDLFDEIFDNGAYRCSNGIYQFGSKDLTSQDPEDDIVAISKENPEITFMLQVRGESTWDDLWATFIKNGETEYSKAEIVIRRPDTIEWRGDLTM